MLDLFLLMSGIGILIYSISKYVETRERLLSLIVDNDTIVRQSRYQRSLFGWRKVDKNATRKYRHKF